MSETGAVKRVRPVSQMVISRVRQARKRRHMSAAHLAEAMTEAGYPTSRLTLANAEAGRKAWVSAEMLVGFSEVLGISVEDLLAGAEQCHVCGDIPPHGMKCMSCGMTGGTP